METDPLWDISLWELLICTFKHSKEESSKLSNASKTSAYSLQCRSTIHGLGGSTPLKLAPSIPTNTALHSSTSQNSSSSFMESSTQLYNSLIFCSNSVKYVNPPWSIGTSFMSSVVSWMSQDPNANNIYTPLQSAPFSISFIRVLLKGWFNDVELYSFESSTFISGLILPNHERMSLHRQNILFSRVCMVSASILWYLQVPWRHLSADVQ